MAGKKQADIVGMFQKTSEFLIAMQKQTGQSADAIMQQILSGNFTMQLVPKAVDASDKAIPDWKEKGLRSAYDGAKLTGPELVALYNAGKRNFAGANLTRAELQWENLKGADLNGVDLRWADLTSTNLDETNLKEAYLYGSNFWLAKNLTAKQLATVHPITREGIEKIQHFLSLIPVAD